MHDLDNLFWHIKEPSVLHEDQDFIVVIKPSNMHTAPISDTTSLCHWLYQRRSDVASVIGRNKGEAGLLHRLDYATSGLVLFAANDLAFNKAIQAAENNNFIKTYQALAFCSDAGLTGSSPILTSPDGDDNKAWNKAILHNDISYISEAINNVKLSSYFRPYGPSQTRVACSIEPKQRTSKKKWTQIKYDTDIKSCKMHDNRLLCEIQLKRGFRHQIRAHFAWLGLPLVGDEIYGEASDNSILYLRATKIQLKIDNHELNVELPLANTAR